MIILFIYYSIIFYLPNYIALQVSESIIIISSLYLIFVFYSIILLFYLSFLNISLIRYKNDSLNCLNFFI